MQFNCIKYVRNKDSACMLKGLVFWLVSKVTCSFSISNGMHRQSTQSNNSKVHTLLLQAPNEHMRWEWETMKILRSKVKPILKHYLTIYDPKLIWLISYSSKSQHLFDLNMHTIQENLICKCCNRVHYIPVQRHPW